MQVVGVFGLDDSVAFQFFAAPMLGSAANCEGIARIISKSLDHSLARLPLLTIAENGASTAFNEFCNALEQVGLVSVCDSNNRCDGGWLRHCSFFVTTYQRHWSNLKLKTFTKP